MTTTTVPYREIFERVEATLIREGSKRLPEALIRQNLDHFKKVAERRELSDDEYYFTLVYVTFFSGFRATTVERKIDVICSHFPDYRTVANYDEARIAAVLNDPQMIRNRAKVRACVANARAVARTVAEYSSMQAYIDAFAPRASVENLMALRDDLRSRFAYLGKVTVYHFMADVGLPVVKPDRVVRRIFHRLGLIEGEGDEERNLQAALAQGQAFSRATGHPLRYVDIVFVSYGQVRADKFGIERGICLSDRPRCDVCGIRTYCQYADQQRS